MRYSSRQYPALVAANELKLYSNLFFGFRQLEDNSITRAAEVLVAS